MVEQDELLEMLPCSHSSSCSTIKTAPHQTPLGFVQARRTDSGFVACGMPLREGPDPVVRVQDRGCPPLEQVYDQYEGIACRFRIPASSEGRSDLRGEALRESVSATQKSLVT